MPKSEKQRRAAFAEVKRRESGKGKKLFAGMTAEELKKYAHSPLHKKRK